MIFDYIRDFIVQYIFGGTTSNDELYDIYIGGGLMGFDTGYNIDNSGLTLSICDWLSTTATIVIMVLVVVLACLLVRWVWRVVSSAFLLR